MAPKDAGTEPKKGPVPKKGIADDMTTTEAKSSAEKT